TEGLYRPPARADRGDLDHDARGHDQRPREVAHRARHRVGGLQRGAEGKRLQPPRARAGNRQVSARIAGFIYRRRLALTALVFAGAILSIPSVDITHIDNDITAWFSKEDPVYKDYERFRAEFGGTRSLIIALKADSADRLFGHDALRFIDRITGDIERVDAVQRVASLATAT